MHFVINDIRNHAAGGAPRFANSGPKGPPSAPPTIPPIIINPFNRETPAPAIDPRQIPVGPPIRPPQRPNVRI